LVASADSHTLLPIASAGIGKLATGAAVSYRELTTLLTTTMTTVGLTETATNTTREFVLCLLTPSACSYGSEGWEFESLRAHSTQRRFPSLRRPRYSFSDDSSHRWSPSLWRVQQRIHARDGTVSISATTLSAVVADIAESCAQQGITALIIINAHGGMTGCILSASGPDAKRTQ
jgi:hypothetical protein